MKMTNIDKGLLQTLQTSGSKSSGSRCHVVVGKHPLVYYELSLGRFSVLIMALANSSGIQNDTS
jgi:hypothetical protein